MHSCHTNAKQPPGSARECGNADGQHCNGGWWWHRLAEFKGGPGPQRSTGSGHYLALKNSALDH